MDDELKAVYMGNDQPEPPKQSFGSQFWELFKQSVIMQATLSFLMVGTYCYLTIAGKPISPEFFTLLGLIVGFFFGGKMGLAQGKEAVRASNQSK